MEFRDKLKKRLHLGIAYIVIGIIMIISSFVFDNVNPFISSYGLALAVMGVVRIRNYKLITKNDETIRRQEIAETDERNIALSNKAKSWAFYLYVIGASILVITLQFTQMRDLATEIAYTVCILIALYWISYWVLRRKY